MGAAERKNFMKSSVLLDFTGFIAYNQNRCLGKEREYSCVKYKEVDIYENDIPAKKETESKGSWFQIQNEHSRRKKSSCCKKS